MALVMVLPLVRYLQIQTESKLIRLGLYGLMILIGFSIIGSQSRGAFLGGCTIAAFLIWKSRQRLMLSLLVVAFLAVGAFFVRSEEHKSELQSLMRISYAVFCL